MSTKKLRFEPIPKIDPSGGLAGYNLEQQTDEELLNAVKSTGSPEAKAYLLHRYSRYATCDVDSLLSIAEEYLNGKLSSSVKMGNDTSPVERPIDIDSLLAELEYKGIRVLNIDYNPQSIDDLSIGNLGTRIIEEMPDTLEYIMNRDHYGLANVKGKVMYKRLGITYPLRGVDLTFVWEGSHDGTVTLRNKLRSGQDGSFSISSPKGLIVSMLKILIVTPKQSDTRTFTLNELKAKDGDLGELIFKVDHSGTEGLFETLENRMSNMENVVDNIRSEEVPSITVGEGDDMFVLSVSTVPSTYSYKMLNRLLAPEMIGLGMFNNNWDTLMQIPYPHFERVAINTPIDIDYFRSVTNLSPQYQIRMGSLGIGYVLTMQQEWRPSGFSLGNLMYSVALAPGEEQRVIITDRAESYNISDSETLLSDLGETYDSEQDSDTDAVFNRALNEHESGSTNMKSVTKGTSAGAIGGLFATGSTTRNTTDSSSSNNLSREQASAYSQSMNESIARQANRERDSSRMGIRLATSEEASSVTSKIISNHNHSHSLTMQYWEVVKNYIISTRIADVGLVCYIPFELIPFLPNGQDPTIGPSYLLSKASVTDSELKEFFYTRYETVLKYFDSLYPYSPWEYRKGLNLMKKYSSYLDWDFQHPDGRKLSTMTLTVKARMLSYQKINAFLHLKNNKGVIRGFLKSGGTLGKETPNLQTEYELIEYLERRKSNTEHTLEFVFEVPPHIQDDDFDRLTFDVEYLRSASYQFTWSEEQLKALEKFKSEAEKVAFISKVWPGAVSKSTRAWYSQRTISGSGGIITLSYRDFMDIGPPVIESIRLVDKEKNKYLEGSYNLPLHSTLSFSVQDAKPTMSFEELQQIERAFQHIVENSIMYSKVVWRSTTPEERAMLFERYNMALPGRTGSDIGKEIPLSNCIENRIVGFYGNCMIVPFSLPPEIADILHTTTRDIQDALFSYHAESFRSPETKVSLPAGGIVGEAVLGGSNTSEVIDITRFWNWGDSPIDPAPSIDLGKIPNISLLSGAAAPNELTTLEQQLSLGNIAATSIPDVAAALTAEGAAFQDITNKDEVASHMTTIAEKAADERMNAVNKSTAVAKTAMKAAVNIATGGASGAAEAAMSSKGGGSGGDASGAAQTAADSAKKGDKK